MQLVKPDHELLRTKLEDFDFENPPVDPKQLVADMYEIMIERNGIGLSANQIGLPYRVFIMRGADGPIACFNPKITFFSEETNFLEEGCLSLPGFFVKIHRPEVVRAKYQTVDGTIETKRFGGMTARCFQHELEHLNGVMFTDKASKYHLEKARRKTKIMQRKMRKAV